MPETPGPGFGQIAPCPVIDAHAHLFPDKMLAAMWAWFSRHAWPVKYQMPAARLAAFLPAAGAAGQVLLVYAHKPGVAEGLNEFLCQALAANPGSLGLAAVHPADKDPAGLLKRAWQNPAIKGAKLHQHVLGLPMDDPVFFPIYRACQEQGKLLNVHAGTQPASPGYGLDVTKICGMDRVARVLERFPGLRLIVPHLGWDQCDECLALMDRFPGLLADTTMVLAGYFPGAEVRRELLERHSGRIMYGSDFPNIPYDFRQEVRHILGLGLSEQALRDILWRTAAREFGFGIGAQEGQDSRP